MCPACLFWPVAFLLSKDQHKGTPLQQLPRFLLCSWYVIWDTHHFSRWCTPADSLASSTYIQQSTLQGFSMYVLWTTCNRCYKIHGVLWIDVFGKCGYTKSYKVHQFCVYVCEYPRARIWNASFPQLIWPKNLFLLFYLQIISWDWCYWTTLGIPSKY